jgi:hypothetical protein
MPEPSPQRADANVSAAVIHWSPSGATPGSMILPVVSVCHAK